VKEHSIVAVHDRGPIAPVARRYALLAALGLVVDPVVLAMECEPVRILAPQAMQLALAGATLLDGAAPLALRIGLAPAPDSGAVTADDALAGLTD
jgi:hypothetical protein